MAQLGEGIPKNLNRAVELFGRACQNQHPRACFTLGFALQHGKGVSASPSLAASHYKAACEGGELRACKSLGVMLAAGWEGKDPDLKGARQLLNESCKKHLKEACLELKKLP